MSDDQEMVDVEVVDIVGNDEDLVNRDNLKTPSIFKDSGKGVENIVVVNTGTKDIKEEENLLDIVEENNQIQNGSNANLKSNDKEISNVLNGAAVKVEDKQMELEKTTVECEVPTFVQVLREEFDESKGETIVVPVCIQPLNSDNSVPVPIPVAEEGEKRKRKRVPRKIEKIETTENGAPVDNKPYKCDMCHWQFKQRYRFKRHMRTHTGERPYQCPQCEKQFSRSHILKVHMMIHTGEKPFICEECGWSFMKKYHLQRHMRTHTGEMPFVCEECGVHFSRQYYLKKHLVSAHGAAIVIKPAGRKKKSASNGPETMVVENTEKNYMEVVYAFKVDPSEEGTNREKDGSSIEGEDDLSNNGDKDGDKSVPGPVKENLDESLPESEKISTAPNGPSISSEDQYHTIVISPIQNGSPAITESKAGNIDAKNQNGASSNSAIQNGTDGKEAIPNGNSVVYSVSQSDSVIISSSQSSPSKTNKSEASLKECIEMVNQLVERKPMETMIIKRDAGTNQNLETNNETEPHIDVDFQTIPVK